MNAIPMEIPDDRKTTIVIEGVEYDLVFNSRAVRKVCEKYGDLDGFKNALNDATYSEAVGQNVWLTTLLVNQGIAIYNRNNPDNQRSVFTEDEIELLSCPGDWEAARYALIKGGRRDIVSEEEPSKNAEVG